MFFQNKIIIQFKGILKSSSLISQNIVYDFEIRPFSLATNNPILEILRISESLLY